MKLMISNLDCQGVEWRVLERSLQHVYNIYDNQPNSDGCSGLDSVVNKDKRLYFYSIK